VKTKDWLLHKFAGEVTRHEETKRLYQESLVRIDELSATITAMCVREQAVWDKEVELIALREQCKRMAPEKQFRILMHADSLGDQHQELSITSVASAAGQTTISVLRPPNLVWK